MNTVTTPSQLKKEVESQKDVLLRACFDALNQLPNKSLRGLFPTTEVLAEKIAQVLQTTE
ncbi:cobalamin biosynthesis protein CbiX [Salmonella enterica subsp. enterica serovar Meleagridis]|nr:cobalamin biosynthesis protein CbiX [Salmonella enterica subsp. enterica serovar Cerro]EGD4263617.1 cobalamin biosynthesis protein CbiX [Salmonella enterica subsp. enterica serovar Cerro]EGD4267968.1 cobalamin biosynthesis protein CbiX [Salmonella enterica subsp. enterica serovar Cerro]EGD4276612.1 cobalamin biosynthesis protein CbiX [Salmonella enterica subsp. enterica serovar Meleagridis]EGD4286615.1 cobalamin biosynthesis protein CbiX [Salmonella enterica subsp. enterica serovar Meleagrid